MEIQGQSATTVGFWWAVSPCLKMDTFLQGAHVHGLSWAYGCPGRERGKQGVRGGERSVRRIHFYWEGPTLKTLGKLPPKGTITKYHPPHWGLGLPQMNLVWEPNIWFLTNHNWIEQRKLWRNPDVWKQKVTLFHVSNKTSRRNWKIFWIKVENIPNLWTAAKAKGIVAPHTWIRIKKKLSMI